MRAVLVSLKKRILQRTEHGKKMNIYLDDILREVGEPDAAFPLSMKLEPFELLSSDPDFSEENVL